MKYTVICIAILIVTMCPTILLGQNTNSSVGKVVYKKGKNTFLLFFNESGCINVYQQDVPQVDIKNIATSLGITTIDSDVLASKIKSSIEHNNKADNNSLYKGIFTPYYYTRTNYINGVKYCVSDTVHKDAYKWRLLPDNLTFLQLKCRKAEMQHNGITYFVIYTTEISLPYGPERYGGLPGVILCIEDSVSKMKTEAIEIEYPYTKVVPIPISPCTDGISISLQNFRKLINKQNTDINEILKAYNKDKQK
ncbi:MAG: GLPGLI family protein [Chitinophagaceae bacterium]